MSIRWFGSVYPGGGFAAGAGVRKPFGDDGASTCIGGYSINSFWRARGDVALPTFAHEPRAGHAVGPLHRRARREVLRRRQRHAQGRPDALRLHARGRRRRGSTSTPSRYLSLGGGVNYLDIDTSTPARTGPSIEERFSPADTPGLELDSFSYVNSTARAAFDWRRPPGYSGSGGLYRVQFDDYRERDNDRYSFRSLEAEVRQLIPLLRANWVHRAARPRDGDRHRRDERRAVLPAAVARRRQHAARATRTSAFAIATGWS